MKIIFALSLLLLVSACDLGADLGSKDDLGSNDTAQQSRPQVAVTPAVGNTKFEWIIDRVGDTEIARYKVSGFDSLPLKHKKLAYYLTRAGQAGRDIIWDQTYRHNLTIRRALEAILSDPSNASSDAQWASLVE
jgi:dipeptidyl-peptidase-3